MILEIVTPEKIVFSAEVISVAVPSINGEFQILDNHAPVVAVLSNGNLKIDTKESSEGTSFADLTKKDQYYTYSIKGGVVEVKNNKVIVLAD